MAEWLIAHAKQMTEGMFFNPRTNWRGVSSENLFALRAFAPNGVFTTTAKGAYLARVSDDEDLAALAPALFGSDSDLVDKLPTEYYELHFKLVTLMQLAYRHRIRPADHRVKNM